MTWWYYKWNSALHLYYNVQTTHLGIHSGPPSYLPPFWCKAKCGESRWNSLCFRMPSLEKTDGELHWPCWAYTNRLFCRLTLAAQWWPWLYMWPPIIYVCLSGSVFINNTSLYGYVSHICGDISVLVSTVSTWDYLSWFLCDCFGSTVSPHTILFHNQALCFEQLLIHGSLSIIVCFFHMYMFEMTLLQMRVKLPRPSQVIKALTACLTSVCVWLVHLGWPPSKEYRLSQLVPLRLKGS